MKRIARFLKAITFIAATLFFTVNATAASGDVDPTFKATLAVVPGNDVYQTAVQPDGKTVIFGQFHVVDGIARDGLARLNADGTLDTSFNPPKLTFFGGPVLVTAIAIQTDGKIVIAGRFTSLNGVYRGGLARLNSDGTPDTAFNSSTALNGLVQGIAMRLDSDGSIVFSADKNFGGPANHPVLIRVNSDGSFNKEIFGSTAADLLFLPDGKILRSVIDGVQRLNPDLTTDGAFQEISVTGRLARQSDGKIIVAGSFSTYNEFPIGKIARFNVDGSFDATFNTNNDGANNPIYTVAVLPNDKIVIGGIFSSYNSVNRQKIAILNSDGTLDSSNPQTDFLAVNDLDVRDDGTFFAGGTTPTQTPFVHGPIVLLNSDGSRVASFSAKIGWGAPGLRLFVLPDGKFFASGLFNNATGAFRNGLAKFNADGSVDSTFDPTAFTSTFPTFNAIGVQADDKIIVGGANTGRNLTRLNSDGSLDIEFPNTPVVHDTKIQQDGNILVSGIDSGTTPFIRRYNANGTLDTTFNVSVNDDVLKIVLQPDGKVLIAGDFLQVNSANRGRIARLNTDGSLDTTFNPPSGANAAVYDAALQSDGKVIIGGIFSGVNFSTQANIARLNTDGSLDAGFNPQVSGAVETLKVQPDDRVLIGGAFEAVNNTVRPRIARLTKNGSLDFRFDPGTGTNNVTDIEMQPDGRVLAVGNFQSFDGSLAIGIVRLLNSLTSHSLYDFDGDGRADISVFRPSTNRWYELRSSDSQVEETTFGAAGDIPVAADFDGDGKTDEAIFRPSTGSWWYQSSIDNSHNAVQFGQAGDVPRPSDFDGDGRSDFIVYRPSTSVWYRLGTTGQVSVMQFGTAEDKPVVGDFDGDGKSDVAVYRPSTGTWWYAASGTAGQFHAVQFGISTDIPAPADFDGDGRTDLAVYRPSQGVWYILKSSNGSVVTTAFGISEDRPVPADYDGDGQADIAVFRPSTGVWYLLQSTSGFGAVQFGITEDRPIPGSFIQ